MLLLYILIEIKNNENVYPTNSEVHSYFCVRSSDQIPNHFINNFASAFKLTYVTPVESRKRAFPSFWGIWWSTVSLANRVHQQSPPGHIWRNYSIQTTHFAILTFMVTRYCMFQRGQVGWTRAIRAVSIFKRYFMLTRTVRFNATFVIYAIRILNQSFGHMYFMSVRIYKVLVPAPNGLHL